VDDDEYDDDKDDDDDVDSLVVPSNNNDGDDGDDDDGNSAVDGSDRHSSDEEKGKRAAVSMFKKNPIEFCTFAGALGGAQNSHWTQLKLAASVAQGALCESLLQSAITIHLVGCKPRQLENMDSTMIKQVVTQLNKRFYCNIGERVRKLYAAAKAAALEEIEAQKVSKLTLS
jgi:hypothetical protein